jgi:hypothetical protein
MVFRQTPRVAADEADATIRRLKDDLYLARHAIIQLAPDEFHRFLESYYDCRTREDTYRWPEAVADAIVDLAVPIQDNPHAHLFGPRAYCPLCRGGASGYSPGFTLPEGLAKTPDRIRQDERVPGHGSGAHHGARRLGVKI